MRERAEVELGGRKERERDAAAAAAVAECGSRVFVAAGRGCFDLHSVG